MIFRNFSTANLTFISLSPLQFIKIFYFILLAFAAIPTTGFPFSAINEPTKLIPNIKPVRSCESLISLALTHTKIREAKIITEAETSPSWCKVTAVIYQPNTDNEITIWVGLPISNWNGRFQGTGGGGFVSGDQTSIPPYVSKGYVTAATNAGISLAVINKISKGPVKDGTFVTDHQGRLDWTSVQNIGYLGIHKMTITGKAITKAFYGVETQYSYFHGCSTGGRQGLMEAQRYPEDYDGILSEAPAINWTKLIIGVMWGQYLMLRDNNFLPQCKLEAATDAAIQACDRNDGIRDGLIGNPRNCRFDAKTLVGSSFNECDTFTTRDATIINKIWEGPRGKDGSFLWYGLSRGAPLGRLNATEGTPLEGKPGVIPQIWISHFLLQDPDWDWKTLDYNMYERIWKQSIEQYAQVYATDNPDLSSFRNHGGKILMWHGENDQIIAPEGSIDYIKRVQKKLDGASSFIQLFLAPGVEHCRGGNGPMPTALQDTLLKWVEKGKAPRKLMAVKRGTENKKVVQSRPLCQYPQVALYTGKGSTDIAGNFECRFKNQLISTNKIKGLVKKMD